ncbi:MAG: hypothetical protein UT20_C0003G0021 [Candidatus Levybacteria bacterium GW2011_GWA1_39_11]|nr:MAG: hypothetical protein UT20_C0003G0021 [Candidatus Levybacteria bacterium GW2011_GWA1_39_11]KKR27437.1 MAG: hypothetical protein UT57_C0005G0005 [Microgenomates group bacterium GW2011_GWC1_39_7]
MSIKQSAALKTNKRIIIFKLVILLLVEIVLFGILFKEVRTLFPPSFILSNEKTTVGYVHYFGYPFFYDTFLFFAIMVSPIVTFMIVKISSKK